LNPKILFATTTTLEVAYEQSGPISADPVLLLYGFPYDVREFDAVGDRLAGRRVIVALAPDNSELWRSRAYVVLDQPINPTFWTWPAFTLRKPTA
jgi:hypothetical protein